MRTPRGFLFTLSFIALSFISPLAPAQDIPPGVHYKTSSTEMNTAAKTLMENALKNPAIVPLSALDSTLTCGPLLWNDLKPTADATLLKSKTIDFFLQIPEVIHAESRGMTNDDQRRSFWLKWLAKYPALKGAHLRKATRDEISYYWSTIPFDIEEPFLVIDADSDRFTVHFLVHDGKPFVFWIDRVGDLHALKATPLPAQNADSAAADFVEEKILPEGWKRRRFAWDGGLTLSIVMPDEPKEHDGPAQVNTTTPITMTAREISSNFRSGIFTAFYTSLLSREVERLSAAEKTAVLASIVGPSLHGMIDALKQNGAKVQPSFGKPQQITISGHPGVEQEVSILPYQARARAILLGHYAYGAMVFWTTSTPHDLPNTFLDSLRIE